MKDNTNSNLPNYIKERSIAHMITQIRVKQLSIKYAQDYLINKIIVELEDTQEKSGDKVIKEIIMNLKLQHDQIEALISDLKKEDVQNIGFPIKYNKTDLQLKMALEYAQQNEDCLLNDMINKVFYHKLRNTVPEQLPALQSSSLHSFWGNENSSVSTVLLYSIAHSIKCDINNKNLMGAGRFFPFYNPDYSISINPDNCFTFNKGVILFGDYQFGGHRYFSNKYPGLGQFVLGPEDCSSSVGKATGLNNEQILSINTKQLKDAYKNQENQYGYQAITTNDNEQFKLEKINPGDIYVCGSYTTIIYSRDNYSNIATLGFNRDIEHPELKQLGGGTYEYNLMNIQDKQLYILRSNNCSIKEETSFYNFINKIDTAFLEQTEKDIIGDCDIYL